LIYWNKNPSQNSIGRCLSIKNHQMCGYSQNTSKKKNPIETLEKTIFWLSYIHPLQIISKSNFQPMSIPPENVGNIPLY